MESLIFLALVLAAIGVVAFLMCRASRAKKSRPDYLTKGPKAFNPRMNVTPATPGNNVLAHSNEIWEQRRRQAANQSRVPQSKPVALDPQAEPEYDGYSRSGRRHVAPAHIQSEKHCDDADLPGMRRRDSGHSDRSRPRA